MKRVDNIRESVKKRYAQAAKAVLVDKAEASCGCSSSCCGDKSPSPAAKDAISRNLYGADELKRLPAEAYLASLGCGNPTALAELREGESVLDLGSGGGIDVLLSARRVGPAGFAYGLDMTDEMLELAEKNRTAAGVTNVKFLKGHIEEIPLPDETVDVIVSNCVINLSGDKDSVLREAYRVLRPGGRFAVSDMVVDGELPAGVRADVAAWSGCVAGALSVEEYRRKLSSAGFVDVEIVATRKHTAAELAESGLDAVDRLTAEARAALDNRLWSAFVRAAKPVA